MSVALRSCLGSASASAALPAQAQIGEHALGRRHADVGHEQGRFERFEVGIGECLAADYRGERRGQALARSGETGAQPLAPGAVIGVGFAFEQVEHRSLLPANDIILPSSPRWPPPSMAANAIRIIGGQWRGRRLRFPAAPTLRPTPDRVRETLFNWLGQDLTGLARLDPFAGSGALSFEALSRGAALAVAVDRDRALVRALLASAQKLGAQRTRGALRRGAEFSGARRALL